MYNKFPSLTGIKAFEAAARLKSFKQAADELNVSPTAVSHQIRGIEEALKIKLFLRHTRSVSLTHEGELLAATATRMFRELLQTVNAITGTPDTLIIGTTNSFAAMWLVPKLADFQLKNPKIIAQIRADDELQDIKLDKRIDMVIRYGKYAEQPGAELLINESLGFFATPACWQHFDNADQLTFLCVEWKNKKLSQQNYKQLLENIIPSGKKLDIRYFNDENQILQATLAGQGIAILSELLLKIPLSHGWLQPGFIEESSSLVGLDYYCIVPERSSRNKAVLSFVNWLRNSLTV